MTTPRLKMLLFTAPECSACQHMKKAALPLFKKSHPDLVVEEIEISLEGDGDPTKEALADSYGVKGLPAILFALEGLPRGSGTDATLAGLNALLKKAGEVLKKAGGS